MVDCFPFFNELDILEIRLNLLKPYVTRFVLAECRQTHSGKPKPLFFEDNKDRFKEFNITHLIIPNMDGTSWEREGFGRRYLMNGIKDVKSDEMILVSDLDEIPDLATYNGQEGVFRHKVFCYYLNCFTGISDWPGTVAIRRGNLKDISDTRTDKPKYPTVGSGWHFSYMGSAEQIIYKLESFAHQELNTKERKAHVTECRDKLMSLSKRNYKFIIQDPGLDLSKYETLYHHS